MTDYRPGSFCDISLRAQEMAVSGASPHEISERCNIPMSRAEEIVTAYAEHKRKWADALQK